MAKNDSSAVPEGRKLAIKMMEELIDNGDTTLCSVERRWRPRGTPQFNITLPFIQEVCRRPELAEGFAAVLSDYLTLLEGPMVEKSYYRAIEKNLRRAEKKIEVAHV